MSTTFKAPITPSESSQDDKNCSIHFGLVEFSGFIPELSQWSDAKLVKWAPAASITYLAAPAKFYGGLQQQ
jgi:hypothetical protein